MDTVGNGVNAAAEMFKPVYFWHLGKEEEYKIPAEHIEKNIMSKFESLPRDKRTSDSMVKILKQDAFIKKSMKTWPKEARIKVINDIAGILMERVPRDMLARCTVAKKTTIRGVFASVLGRLRGGGKPVRSRIIAANTANASARVTEEKTLGFGGRILRGLKNAGGKLWKGALKIFKL